MELNHVQSPVYQLSTGEDIYTSDIDPFSRPTLPQSTTDSFHKSLSPNNTYDRTGTVSLPGEQKEAETDTRVDNRQGSNGNPLSEEDAAQVQKLKQTDRKVRTHEQAHMAAGAGLVRGGARFTYENGPDGVRYAVGGEVSIDTSTGKTPQETIARMQRVRAAALAPADPSPQDRSVAAAASAKAAAAAAELANESRAEMKIPGDKKASHRTDTAGIEAYQRSMQSASSSCAGIDCMI